MLFDLKIVKRNDIVNYKPHPSEKEKSIKVGFRLFL